MLGRERSKSDGRGGGGSAAVEVGRTKLASGQQGDDSRSQATVGGGKGTAVRTSKFRSLFPQLRIAATGNDYPSCAEHDHTMLAIVLVFNLLLFSPFVGLFITHLCYSVLHLAVFFIHISQRLFQ